MSLYSVTALLILDNDGKRIYAKYYDPPHGSDESKFTEAEQLKFEEALEAKTKRQHGDLLLFQGHLVCYKQLSGPTLYLVSPPEENEAMMFQALVGIRDALDYVLENQTDRQSLLDHYDKVALVMDEAVDGGILLEPEYNVISARVTSGASDEPSLQNLDFSEKGIKSMFGFARNKLAQAVKQQLA